MKFIKLKPELSEAWDGVVFNSEEAWMYHLYNWLAMTERVFNLEPESFLLEQDKEILGIFPLQFNKQQGILKSIFMGTGGPALKKGLDAPFREKALKLMFEHAEEIARQINVSVAEIYLPPLSEASLNNRWGVNPLVSRFYSDISTHSRIIDLSKPKDEIYDNISRNAKREIKEAADKGYRVREIKSRDEMDIYYAVHCQTYQRTGVRPHPKEYFLGIYDHFVLANLAKTLVAVNNDNNPVAFTNLATFMDKALYWTTCCKNEDFKNGVYYLLVWHAIEYAKDKGFKWFDCAEAFPGVRDGKLKGLSEFKGKFGGELHRYFKGRLILATESEKKKLLKDWVRDTTLLLKPVFGEKIVNFTIEFLYKIYLFTIRIYRFLRRCRRVNFLKPYWGPKELLTGFFYREKINNGRLNILIDKFSGKFNLKGIVIPTSSGRVALELALRVLKNNRPAKQKVIIPSYGCKGTFDPIINAGLIPVFADIDKNLNMSKNSVKKYIDDQVLAILVPYLCGCKPEIEEISKIAKEKNIAIIEDVCQALGGKDGDDSWGKKYDMSIFSFGMGKNLMATAGGILLSNIYPEQICEEAKKLGKEETCLVKRRFKDIFFKYFLKFDRNINQHLLTAYQYNAMHSLDAKLICSQLDKLDAVLDKRRENAGKLKEALSKTNLRFYLQDATGHAYTKFPIIFEDLYHCEIFKDYFYNRGIELEEMYIPLHLKEFAIDFYQGQDLAYSEKIYKNIFNIPVRPNLSHKQLSGIIKTIEDIGKRISGD